MSAAGGVRVSVCMATYNGQEYVAEQIQSILSQLSPADELIIVDDASKDNTLDVVRRLEDPRIVLLPSAENKGYVASFEKAVSASRGEYIMLSDQDDIWLPGRVETLVNALQTKDFAASNFTVFGGPANRYHKVQLKESDSGRWLANLVTTWIGIRPYYGCTMAFTSRAKNMILPSRSSSTRPTTSGLPSWATGIGAWSTLRRPQWPAACTTTTRRPSHGRPVAVILRARMMLLRAFLVALGRKADTR